MTKPSYEQEQQSSIANQAIDTCLDTYRVLRRISESFTYEQDAYDNPEGQALTKQVDEFVKAHVAEYGQIENLAIPDALSESSRAWSDVRLRKMIVRSLYYEIVARKQQEIDKLLAGKIIKATSLVHAFGVSDGYTVATSPDGPREITAPYLSVDPHTGTLILGKPHKNYRVELFELEDFSNPESVIKPAASIEVL